jgi:palmitoyltransferase ZDHHC13/17
MFLTLEVLAMIITGSATIISNVSSSLSLVPYNMQHFVCVCFIACFVTGIVRDPASPASFGAWVRYSAVHHTGAVSFIAMDIFLFFGVVALTVVQASLVCQRNKVVLISRSLILKCSLILLCLDTNII